MELVTHQTILIAATAMAIVDLELLAYYGWNETSEFGDAYWIMALLELCLSLTKQRKSGWCWLFATVILVLINVFALFVMFQTFPFKKLSVANVTAANEPTKNVIRLSLNVIPRVATVSTVAGNYTAFAIKFLSR